LFQLDTMEVLASILASAWNDHVLEPKHLPLQDTNDRFLANIQRDGTYSVVPRVPAGEITPDQLIVLGQVAKKFGLYTKITGGQRIDLFGAQVHQLPLIWADLIAAGVGERFHVYVLSDTDDAAIAAQEDASFGVLAKRWDGRIALTYRRRADNAGFKAGNVRDFCERWGDRHDLADGRLFESFLNQNTNKCFLERLRAGVSAALHRSATHRRRLFLRCRNPNTSHQQMPYSPGILLLGGSHGLAYARRI